MSRVRPITGLPSSDCVADCAKVIKVVIRRRGGGGGGLLKLNTEMNQNNSKMFLNTMLFYVILCLFCGFQVRESEIIKAKNRSREPQNRAKIDKLNTE